jgi:hypothetical protein
MPRKQGFSSLYTEMFLVSPQIYNKLLHRINGEEKRDLETINKKVVPSNKYIGSTTVQPPVIGQLPQDESEGGVSVAHLLDRISMLEKQLEKPSMISVSTQTANPQMQEVGVQSFTPQMQETEVQTEEHLVPFIKHTPGSFPIVGQPGTYGMETEYAKLLYDRNMEVEKAGSQPVVPQPNLSPPSSSVMETQTYDQQEPAPAAAGVSAAEFLPKFERSRNVKIFKKGSKGKKAQIKKNFVFKKRVDDPSQQQYKVIKPRSSLILKEKKIKKDVKRRENSLQKPKNVAKKIGAAAGQLHNTGKIGVRSRKKFKPYSRKKVLPNILEKSPALISHIPAGPAVAAQISPAAAAAEAAPPPAQLSHGVNPLVKKPTHITSKHGKILNLSELKSKNIKKGRAKLAVLKPGVVPPAPPPQQVPPKLEPSSFKISNKTLKESRNKPYNVEQKAKRPVLQTVHHPAPILELAAYRSRNKKEKKGRPKPYSVGRRLVAEQNTFCAICNKKFANRSSFARHRVNIHQVKKKKRPHVAEKSDIRRYPKRQHTAKYEDWDV